MLRRWLASGPLLSRGLCDAIAGLLALLYLAVYANARALLPEFIFRDADKIQAQVAGGDAYQGTSFDAVGHFYRMLGHAGSSLFVAALGVLFIWMTLRQTRRAGSLFANLALLAPCLFFNLFVASKDTLVVLMAMLLLQVARRHGTARTALVGVGLYLAYALLIRNYFALIAGVMFGALLFRRATLTPKIILSGLSFAVLAALPSVVYYQLQHPRDVAVDYLIYGSPFGARTSFYNPFAPDSFVHFIGNYAYSVVRLHLPVLFSPDLKGIAMQCFIALMLVPAWMRPCAKIAQASVLPGAEVLACMVLGHVAVSMLFEPDLGSYMRHLSSVSVLAAALWNQRTGRRYGPLAGSTESLLARGDLRAPRNASSAAVNAGLATRSVYRRP